MIFALSTDTLELFVFADEHEAISYAEGVDVKDGEWLFFFENGQLLKPVFSVPNERGKFSVVSGQYCLSPAEGNSTNLLDILPTVSSVEGKPPFDNIEAISKFVSLNSIAPHDG